MLVRANSRRALQANDLALRAYPQVTLGPVLITNSDQVNLAIYPRCALSRKAVHDRSKNQANHSLSFLVQVVKVFASMREDSRLKWVSCCSDRLLFLSGHIMFRCNHMQLHVHTPLPLTECLLCLNRSTFDNRELIQNEAAVAASCWTWTLQVFPLQLP